MNPSLPRWVDVGLIPLANVLLAFCAAGLIVLAIGADPVQAVKFMLAGALRNSEAIGYTLYYATNYIFTGLAVAVAFHAGLFNIGGEGQAYLGGLGAGLAVLALDHTGSALLIVPVAIAAAAIFGAAWAAIPAYLQAWRGSHIVITTIMFNFLASALMVYLMVNVLMAPGAVAPESRDFAEAASLPLISDWLHALGVSVMESPLNLSLFFALIACAAVWFLVWHTPWGYELRLMGFNPHAALYAGANPRRITLVAMMLSGALAGFVGVNEILGVHHRLLLDFALGYGFGGIAVALMGRNHPIGIVLAGLLFGVLQQGGTELTFEMPQVTREMVIAIQGLVILFSGALALMSRPWFEWPFRKLAARKAARAMSDFLAILLPTVAGTLRLATPLMLCAMGGLFSERAGVIDVGLEGKMLAAAFASATIAWATESGWIGLFGGIVVASSMAMLHGLACITYRGNQVVSGVAINILASGLTMVFAVAWFHRGGQTPGLDTAIRFMPVLFGQSLLVYVALAGVAVTWWLVGRTRFGLRLRAAGEEPAALDAAGLSVAWVRYRALLITGVFTGIAGAYLAIAANANFSREMTAGQGYIALAALIFGKWRPLPAFGACLLFGLLDTLAIRLQGVSVLGFLVPVQLIQALPYILTVTLLAGFIGRAVAPKAIGQPYEKAL